LEAANESGKLILISIDDFEIRVALMENERLVEYYVEDIDKRRIVGNIYLGRVKDILPGMQSAFIDIGLERNAFLFIKEALLPEHISPRKTRTLPKIQNILDKNQEIMVQITREAVEKKGARVSAQLALPGRKLVLLPLGGSLGISRRLDQEERERLHELCKPLKPKEMGLIVRTAAEGATLKELQTDLDYLKSLWRAITKRREVSSAPQVVYYELDLASKIVRDFFNNEFVNLIIDSKSKYNDILALVKKTNPELKQKVKLYKGSTPLFDKYGIESRLESALDRKVWLKSGGYIGIDPTEALTSIDVNTAKFIGSSSLAKTILKTNLEAADEIVNQLRLRDIGGIIVIDFIDMKSLRDRNAVYKAFNKALLKDRTKSRVIEISKLGLVEMTRKNVSAGIKTHYFERCPTCRGTGMILSNQRRRIKSLTKIKEIAKKSRVEALLFELPPTVMDDMQTNSDGRLKKIEEETGKHIYLEANPELELNTINLIRKGKQSVIEAFAANRKR